jgi:hypothetical protein
MHGALDEEISLISFNVSLILGPIGDVLRGVDGRIQESYEFHILLGELLLQILGVWDHCRVELEVCLIAEMALVEVHSLQGESLLSVKLDSIQEIQLVVSVGMVGLICSLRSLLPAEGPEGWKVGLAKETVEILHNFLGCA